MFFVGAFSLLGNGVEDDHVLGVIQGRIEAGTDRATLATTVVGSGDRPNSDGAKADETGKVTVVGSGDQSNNEAKADETGKVTVVGSGDQSNSDGAKADETGKVTVVGSGDQSNKADETGKVTVMGSESNNITITSWNDEEFTDMLYFVCVDEAIKRRKDLSHRMRDIWTQIVVEKKDNIPGPGISAQKLIENMFHYLPGHHKLINVISQALVVNAVEDMEVNANGQVVLFLPEFDEDENLENSSLRKGILIGDVDIVAKKDLLGDEELIADEYSCHKFYEVALDLPVVNEIAIYNFFEKFTDTIDMFEAIKGLRSISKYLFNNDINLDE